jgi:hypothetical protein
LACSVAKNVIDFPNPAAGASRGIILNHDYYTRPYEQPASH